MQIPMLGQPHRWPGKSARRFLRVQQDRPGQQLDPGVFSRTVEVAPQSPAATTVEPAGKGSRSRSSRCSRSPVPRAARRAGSGCRDRSGFGPAAQEREQATRLFTPPPEERVPGIGLEGEQPPAGRSSLMTSWSRPGGVPQVEQVAGDDVVNCRPASGPGNSMRFIHSTRSSGTWPGPPSTGRGQERRRRDRTLAPRDRCQHAGELAVAGAELENRLTRQDVKHMPRRSTSPPHPGEANRIPVQPVPRRRSCAPRSTGTAARGTVKGPPAT